MCRHSQAYKNVLWTRVAVSVALTLSGATAAAVKAKMLAQAVVVVGPLLVLGLASVVEEGDCGVGGISINGEAQQQMP